MNLPLNFGEIWISAGETEIRLGCDVYGESLDHWVKRDLQMAPKDIKKLLENYNVMGNFSLDWVTKKWRGLCENVAGLE